MNPLQEALRVEGLERGYSFPSVSFSPLPEPREIREADLEGIVNALKDSGKLPRDITVLWTDDPKSSHVSPTFRVIAVPLYLLEEHDDSEIVSEVLANYRILKARTGGIA